jgi:hypothetical protein
MTEDGKDAAFVSRAVVLQAGEGAQSSGGLWWVKRSRGFVVARRSLTRRPHRFLVPVVGRGDSLRAGNAWFPAESEQARAIE